MALNASKLILRKELDALRPLKQQALMANIGSGKSTPLETPPGKTTEASA